MLEAAWVPMWRDGVTAPRGDASAAPLRLAQADVLATDVPAQDALKFEIRSYRIEGNTLLPASTIEQALAPFVGRQRDFGDVQRALEVLQDLYPQNGFAGVQVTLPEQELDRGDVTLRVVEPRIRQVLVEGNEHFSADNARRSVPSLEPGQSPRTYDISASMRVANENPAKQSAVLLRPGGKEGEVDAVIRVADVSPLRFSVNFDNTGNEETGKFRTGFAVQHANLFDNDHVLTAQFITSPQNTNDVEVYGLGYRIPFYGIGDSIDLIAGYSTVDSGTVQNLFDVSGQGAVYALRYNYNLRKLGDIEHRVVFGADYRAYQNLVTPIGGNFNFVPDITVHPLSATYGALMRQDNREFSLYLGLMQNIPGGNDGTDETFKASRTDARAAYRIWRMGAVVNGSFLKDWQFRIKLDTQYTRDALIAAEQFGLGGAESVRGFNERYTSNDKGYRSNWELYTPELGTVLGLDKAKFRLLSFYDTGHVIRNSPQPGELESVSLDSAGFGMRLNYGTNFTFKADFAQVLHDGTQTGTPAGRTHNNRLHFSLGFVF
jgi:hemolysin activation/secretion protein